MTGKSPLVECQLWASALFHSFRHKFGRLIYRNRLGTTKLGRNLTQGESDLLVAYATKVFNLSRQTQAWRRHSVDSFESWGLQGQPHSSITQDMLKLAAKFNSARAIPESAFAIEQILSAVGLFEAGFAFAELGQELILQQVRENPSEDNLIRAIQVAIVRGDRESALVSREKLLEVRNKPNLMRRRWKNIDDLENYLNLWQGKACSYPDPPRHTSPLESAWRLFLVGKMSVVYGPGLSTGPPIKISKDNPVIRIAGPGSFTWTNKADFAMGRTDIVYLIRETLERIGSDERERIQILSPYRFVGVKRSTTPYLPTARRVETASQLFLRGHPNMVPLACIDILRVPRTTVCVIGANFFASEISYRQGGVRVNPDGTSQSQAGSAGAVFDRSTLMASHNAIQNRAIIANLVQVGRICGDSEFLEAVSLSNLEYAQRLDRIYGQHKI